MALTPIPIGMALSDNVLTRPLRAGEVAVAGCAAAVTTLHPSEMFWRQLHHAEFDVSEMSLSSLLIAAARGDDRFAAIPVFTMRKVFHTGILVRDDAGIAAPADLAGKRVGVPEYQQTSAIWSRGILHDQFGVSPASIAWHMERGPDRSHGSATAFAPPPGVSLHQIPPDRDIGEMMLAGDLDATLLYLNDRNLVDRSRADLDAAADIRPLFADPAAEARRFFAAAGYLPINHVVVVRRTLLDAHRWLALNLYNAFAAAKRIAAAQAAAFVAPWGLAGLLGESTLAALGRQDPMAYGIAANRDVLETLAAHVHRQGLTPRQVRLDEIFAPATLDL